MHSGPMSPTANLTPRREPSPPFAAPRTLLVAIGLTLVCMAAGALGWIGPAWGGQTQRHADLDAIEKHLEAWDLPRSRRELEAIAKSSPDDPKVLTMQARLAFYSHDYAGAQALFARAYEAGDQRPEVEGSKEFMRLTHEATETLTAHESNHFIVYLDEALDGILADYALDTLEKAHSSLAQLLGFKPPSKVRVEILPDKQVFHTVSTLSPRDIEVIGAIGLCKFNKIMIITPRALARGFRWLDSLAHEYVHFVIVHLSHNNAPIWFHEGLAKYAEALWNTGASNYLGASNQSLLAKARVRDSFISYQRMEPSLVDLDTAEEAQLAYAQSASVIDYILKRHGPPGLRSVLATMAKQQEYGATKAIEQAASKA